MTSMILAFPYLRVVVLMWLSEPGETTPTVSIPGAFTSAALIVGVLATLRARRRPRRRCWTSPTRPPSSSGSAGEPSTADVRHGAAASDVADRHREDVWQRRRVVSATATVGASVGVDLRRPGARGVGPRRSWRRSRRLLRDVRATSGRPAARRGGPAPGRRRRQAVPAAAGGAGRPVRRSARAARSSRPASVVELTHLATLYHDDVMDEAPVRRGAPVANARWGNSIAILAGDFLFARAADLAAELGPEAVRIQAQHLLPAGARPDRRDRRPARRRDPVEHYLQVIADKTGSLIATVGPVRRACSAARRRTQVEALAAYGETIGIAFQLSDDLLDIASRVGASRARRPAPTCARACRRCRCSTRWPSDDDRRRPRSGCGRSSPPARSPTTPLHAEALGAAARVGRAQAGPGDRPRLRRAGPGASWPALPDVPARRALESLCDFIADRTGCSAQSRIVTAVAVRGLTARLVGQCRRSVSGHETNGVSPKLAGISAAKCYNRNMLNVTPT